MSECDKSEIVLVGILCYNHELYIAQCLDSVLCQKCNFSYKVYVFDDASTDGSWRIIQDYKVRYKDKLIIEQPEYNNYSNGNRNAFLQHITKENQAKFVAFCEADDYWTDEYKLQKQYDAMQKNEKASMCIHDVELVNESNGNCMGIVPGYMSSNWSQEELITRILMYSMSFRLNGIFVRGEILNNADMDSGFWNYWAIDLALFVYMILKGEVIYLNNNMAVKRVNNVGSLSHESNLEKNICQQQINMFEEDIRWIEQFDVLSGKKYEDLIEYYKLFRTIKLYYLYQGSVEKNKCVSNGNGKMYLSESSRRINRTYIKLIRGFYKDNERSFAKCARKWMEKEWKRLQTAE